MQTAIRVPVQQLSLITGTAAEILRQRRTYEEASDTVLVSMETTEYARIVEFEDWLHQEPGRSLLPPPLGVGRT